MNTSTEIAGRITAFSQCLTEEGIDRALDKFVLSHGCSIVGSEMENSLRTRVADYFAVSIDCVTIVGSAKLGFSPKPGQYFKPFSGASDIDVAVVSQSLYSRIWKEVFEMDQAGEFFDFDKFRHYHFRGWIRPDKLPSSRVYETCREWWDFFSKLSSEEAYMRTKISAGLYCHEHFFRCYQTQGLMGLRDHIARVAQA